MAGIASGDRAATLLKAFNTAVSLHLAGRLAEAVSVYDGLHRQLPRHPEVLDYYGTARHQLGEHRAALDLLAASVRLRPLAGATRNRLGAVQRALGQAAAAKASFRRAAASDPGLPEPAVNLAAVLLDEGASEDAHRWSGRALAIQPGAFDGLIRRAASQIALGRPERALDDLERARRQQPANPEFRLHFVRALTAVGEGRRAYEAARAGIVASPTAHELYAGLIRAGAAMFENGELTAWARRAVTVRPLSSRLWVNLGAELYKRAEPPAALRAATRALLLEPSLEGAMQTQAAAAFLCNRLPLAHAAARRGLTAHPDNSDIAYSLAEAEFVRGDLGRAWDLYERRIHNPKSGRRLGMPPLWEGPGSESGPLLIASEQGVGDEVIFLSCLPDLLAQVRVPVVVEVSQRLVALMARSFPGVTVVPRQSVPGDPHGDVYDYADLVRRHDLRHAVLAGSLPRYFRRDRDNPTPQGGYLRPAPDRVAHWRATLERFRPARTVGVVWRSARMTRYRALHHAGILDWAPVFAVPGCAFVNLMPGDVQPELDLLRERTGVEIHQLPAIDLWNDIDDLVALMAALDIVVAARTANCAFSAGAGTPTIRVAQSFSRISDGRDFFFSNVWPTLPRDLPFDARLAAEGAARLLRDRVAAS